MDSDYTQKFSLAKLTLSKKRSTSSRPATHSSPTEATAESGKCSFSDCFKPRKSQYSGRGYATSTISDAVAMSSELLSLLESLRDAGGHRSCASSSTQTTEDKCTQISFSDYQSPEKRVSMPIKSSGKSVKVKTRLATERTEDIFSSETDRGVTSPQDFTQFNSSVTGPLLSEQKAVGMGTWVFEVPEELHFSSLDDFSGNSDTLEDCKLRSILDELQYTDDEDVTEKW